VQHPWGDEHLPHRRREAGEGRHPAFILQRPDPPVRGRPPGLSPSHSARPPSVTKGRDVFRSRASAGPGEAGAGDAQLAASASGRRPRCTPGPRRPGAEGTRQTPRRARLAWRAGPGAR
jgi:hypothetical protein